MINWQYYPKSDVIPNKLVQVVRVFENHSLEINSDLLREVSLESNDVLAIVRDDLEAIEFRVERSKRHIDKIKVPVLFGKNGTLEMSFEADAYDEKNGIVIEVEAGRGVTNNQFLKDLFQACMMHNVDYLVIAVKNIYRQSQKDFDKVISFFNTLYASRRLTLPLKGILIIGY